MISDISRAITSDAIETYHRDGFVLLPGMFDSGWIDRLNQGLLANCDDPTDRSRLRDGSGS